jgi:hypothetical protein
MCADTLGRLLRRRSGQLQLLQTPEPLMQMPQPLMTGVLPHAKVHKAKKKSQPILKRYIYIYI